MNHPVAYLVFGVFVCIGIGLRLIAGGEDKGTNIICGIITLLGGCGIVVTVLNQLNIIS